MKIHFQLFIFLFFGCVFGLNGSHTKVTLCDEAKGLSAEKDLILFMSDEKEGAHVGVCYDFMVGAAEFQKAIIKEQFGESIKAYGGSWFGGVAKFTARKLNIDQKMTAGLIESKSEVQAILEKAAGIKKRGNRENDSIFDFLMQEVRSGSMKKTLPEQVASLCTKRVLVFMAKEQQKVVNAIKKQMLGKNLKKGESGLFGTVLDWVVPHVIGHCVKNEEKWRVVFAEMAQKSFIPKSESLKSLMEKYSSKDLSSSKATIGQDDLEETEGENN